MKRCAICKAFLSSYNNERICFRHPEHPEYSKYTFSDSTSDPDEISPTVLKLYETRFNYYGNYDPEIS